MFGGRAHVAQPAWLSVPRLQLDDRINHDRQRELWRYIHAGRVVALPLPGPDGSSATAVEGWELSALQELQARTWQDEARRAVLSNVPRDGLRPAVILLLLGRPQRGKVHALNMLNTITCSLLGCVGRRKARFHVWVVVLKARVVPPSCFGFVRLGDHPERRPRFGVTELPAKRLSPMRCQCSVNGDSRLISFALACFRLPPAVPVPATICFGTATCLWRHPDAHRSLLARTRRRSKRLRLAAPLRGVR